MRKLTLLLAVFLPLTLLAQFQPPTDLEFYYYYFPIDDGGYCNGEVITGPAYCSYFNWKAPDTLPVKAHLLNYRLYIQHIEPYDSSITCFATVSDTFYIVPQGFIGRMWVTAVYENPSGESDSSNNIISYTLPIGITKPVANISPKIWYDYSSSQVRVEEGVPAGEIHLYNVQGQLIKSGVHTNVLPIAELPSGIYFIRAVFKDQTLVVRKKIMK